MNFVVFIKHEADENPRVVVSPFVAGVEQLAKHAPHQCTIISYHANEGEAQLAAHTVPLAAPGRGRSGQLSTATQSRQRLAQFGPSTPSGRAVGQNSVLVREHSAFAKAWEDPVLHGTGRVNLELTAQKHNLPPNHLRRWARLHGLA